MQKLHDIRISAAFVVALLVAVVWPLSAQNEASFDLNDTAAVVADTLIADVDTVSVDPDPEWYIAPVIPAKHRAPQQTAEATKCLIDSVVTYDVDEKITKVSNYDYDATGNVICVTEWEYNSGVRVGKSKQEYGYDDAGRQTMSAVYEWVSSINNWRGTEKAEFVYDDEERITSNTQYAWVNNAWVADKRYTYVFDSQGREKEFTTYTRNAATNQLVYSKCRIQEWDDEDRQILDIQYAAYSGGMWSAGTKKEWKYDAEGNKTEYAYYSSISNGAWVGSSKEEWAYTSGKQTLYATYTWANGAWIGVSKEVWGFESGKDKLYEKYTWNGAWACVERKEWTYNASGKKTLYEYKKLETGAWLLYEQEICEYDGSNQTSYEKYARNNGALVGVSKETWGYTSGTKTKHNTYVWGNNNWADSTEELWEYVSGEETNYEKYAWENGVKVGKEKKTSEYTSGKLTLQQKFSWENSAWAIAEQEVWEYTSNKQTLHEKYTVENGALVGVEKETWVYSSNVLTLHEEFAWLSGAWTAILRESYDLAGNQTLIEEYSISSTNVLSGTKKEEYEFNASGQKILQKIYKWNKSKKLWGTCAVTGFDEAGNTIESCGYTWSNNAWVGSNERVLTTYDSDKRKIDEITQEWNSGGWLNSFRHTYNYSGSRIMQEATFNWVNGAWADSRRTEYHYTDAGQNDSINVYKRSGSDWIYDKRTVNTFDTKGNKILTYVASFVNGKWTLKSMEKLEILFDDANRQILYATWECGPDSIWKGKEKDTTSYSATNKILFRAQYKGWANNKWVGVMLVENKYDDADRLIYEKRLDWDSYLNAWKGNYENEYGYDEQGRKNMTASYDQWDKTLGGWADGSKDESKYDEQDRKIESIMSVWTGVKWRQVFRYTYSFDNSGHEVGKTVEHYENGSWVYTDKYEKEYIGSTLIKNNSYMLLNGEWVLSSQYEQTFDNDAQAKLRRKIEGSWNNGELLSYADERYFYNCDDHYYIVRFVNYDGSLLVSSDVLQGDMPVYTGDIPVKPADAQYTYTFAGWDKAIVPADGHTTYVATFSSTKNKYTITWLNEDGSQIDQTMVEYGAIPTHADPTKANTAEYTYTFAGWDKTPVAVTGEATYKATFSSAKNKYLITFQNEDGSVIEAKEYEYGAMPVAPANPTKEATAQYTYTFSGWDNTIAAVTGVATYKATFSSIVNKYTITWVDGDGNILSTEQVAYGDTPAYTGNTPTKTATDEYTYEFNNSWSPAIVPVTGDATYTALFTETGITPSTYIVTFMDDEGNVLFYEIYSYGQTPDPSYEVGKESDAQYDYTFAGWSPALGPVTGDVTYTATFTTTVRSYTISFVNDDGTTLYEQVLEYGQMPEYVGDVPTKQDDDLYTYTFSGWSPEIEMVAGTATYTATYTAELKQGTAIDNTINEQPVIKVMENGVLYIIRAGQKFTTEGVAVQ